MRRAWCSRRCHDRRSHRRGRRTLPRRLDAPPRLIGEESPETNAARIKYAHALAAGDPAAALALLGDVEALPDDLRGLALLTRAQVAVTLGGDPVAIAEDLRQARVLITGGTEVEAILRRELDALTHRASPR